MRRAGLLALMALSITAIAAAGAHASAAEEPAAEHGPKAAEGEGEGHLEAWKWANFVILAGALGWVISKNAPQFFRSRTEEIQRGIAEAARVRQDAESRAAKMEMRMASLASEIEHLRADAKREMQKESARLRLEAEQQMARIQGRGEQEIAALTRHAEKELRAYSAELAIRLAEERIRNRMSGDTHEALVDGFLRQLDQKATGPGARA